MAQPGYAICPYNSSHNIMKERFQTHLVKCSKNYPDIKLKKCPFNATHLIAEANFDVSILSALKQSIWNNNFLIGIQFHVSECDDKASFDLFRYQIAPTVEAEEKKPDFQSSSIVMPESDENWDDVSQN